MLMGCGTTSSIVSLDFGIACVHEIGGWAWHMLFYGIYLHSSSLYYLRLTMSKSALGN